MNAALLLIGALVFPAPNTRDGFSTVLALSVSQVYDDGLLKAGPSEALFTLLSPRLTAGLQTPRLNLTAFVAIDGQLDDVKPGGSTPWARRTANIELLAPLSDRLTMTAAATYWDTRTPRDAAIGPAFDPGVVDLRSVQAATGLDYRLTALSDATLSGEFLRTDQSLVIIDEVRVQPGLTTRFTPRDTGTFRLLARQITWAGRLASFALVPTLGWTRQLTHTLRASIEGGPRFASGSFDGLEASATVRLDLRPMSGQLSFFSAQTAVPGLVGLVHALGASAAARYRLTRDASLGATVALYDGEGAPLQGRSLQVGVDALLPLSRSVALGGVARHAWQQEDRLGVNGPTTHDQVMVTLTVARESP